MKEARHKGHLFYDSIYVKCQEWQVHRDGKQISDPVCMGGGATGRDFLTGMRFPLGVMEIWLQYTVDVLKATKCTL